MINDCYYGRVLVTTNRTGKQLLKSIKQQCEENRIERELLSQKLLKNKKTQKRYEIKLAEMPDEEY
jgi:hypothetical protein